MTVHPLTVHLRYREIYRQIHRMPRAGGGHRWSSNGRHTALFSISWTSPNVAGFCFGAARGIRTPDPIITNDVLYQLSYCGFSSARRLMRPTPRGGNRLHEAAPSGRRRLDIAAGRNAGKPCRVAISGDNGGFILAIRVPALLPVRHGDLQRDGFRRRRRDRRRRRCRAGHAGMGIDSDSLDSVARLPRRRRGHAFATIFITTAAVFPRFRQGSFVRIKK